MTNFTKQQLREHKARLLAGLPAWVNDHPEWPAYVQESEHEDGIAY